MDIASPNKIKRLESGWKLGKYQENIMELPSWNYHPENTFQQLCWGLLIQIFPGDVSMIFSSYPHSTF